MASIQIQEETTSMKLTRRSAMFAFLAGGAALAGCGGGKQFWNAQPLQAGGILIQPSQVYVNGRRLYVRTTVINQTQAVLTVIRDSVTATLPTGQTVGRSSGSMTLHVPHTIAPGGSHAVHVDFMADGFHWRDYPAVQVNFTGAILANGAPVEIPPFVVQQ
jgi:hypothetical protein